MRLSFALAVLSILSASVNAQDTVGISSCNPSGNWWNLLNNTPGGQDPCQIIVEVRGASAGFGGFTINPSEFNEQNNSGYCNSDAYKLYGACWACQGSSQENANKTTSTLRQWKKCSAAAGNAPDSDAFEGKKPGWVSRYVVPDDAIFDVAQALAAVTNVGTITAPLVSATGSTSAIPTNFVVPTSSPTANSAEKSTAAMGELPSSSQTSNPVSAGSGDASGSPSSSKSSNIGPIVGGVVGGIVVLALLGALFFMFRRRKGRQVAPSAEFAKFHAQPSLQPPRTAMAEAEPRSSVSSAGYAPLGSIPPPPPPDGDGDALPAFTPGHYAGPVFEKGGYVSNPNSPATNPTSHLAASSRGHGAV